MKKSFLTILIILLSCSIHAQWVESTDILSTSDQVSIGATSTNDYNLQVHGKARINSGAETSDLLNINTWISNSIKYKGTMLNFTSTTDGNYGHFKFIEASDANGLKFSLNSQGNLYAAGKVGFGTTSPQTNLELVSTPYFAAHEANSFVIRSSSSSTPNDNRILGMTITLDGSSNIHSIHQKSVGIFAQSASKWSNNVDMLFYTRGTIEAPYFTEKMRILSNGNVGIGTTSTGSHKLAVEGSIGAREVQVQAGPGWPDYVFSSEYNLRTLGEVEQHINEKGHLPEIPSEAEVKENGINLGEMDAKLLQKIEELTLYLIEQNKEIKQLKEQNNQLSERLKVVESK
ncbi:hypothetical protein [Marinoscillum sp.]|uniref:hypothetical protein n=1 Tax=Marinoscillum sp. TaxID=2024838 RepID=UPI003BA8CA31